MFAFRGGVDAIRRVIAVALAVLAMSAPLVAHGQQIGIIRDAEIESMVRGFALPLYRAAGLPREPRIFILNDRRFNAFVTEDGNIYVNYGTILESPTPNALKAVIAHEIGHLAGGHIARLREQMQVQGQVQALSMLLGIGAIAAASGSGASGQVSQMASAFIMASQTAGMNTLMAYRRVEESSADAAALRFLEATGQSPRGLVDTLEILNNDQIARTAAASYVASHPVAEDRLTQVRNAARASPNWGRTDSAADLRAFEMAKAKLVGFLESNTTVANRYPNSNRSLAARYARVIAAYKGGGAVSALQIMPGLVAEQPSNPFLHELLGQMLYETGNPAAAVPHLRRAVELAPDETQIRILYGQAMIGAGGGANLNEAMLQLRRAATREYDSPRVHTLLSQAYAGLGMAGEASLSAAEAALARDQLSTALGLARQAQQQLTPGSPAFLRAGDILSLN